jgi:hypothetical protein
LLCEIRIDGITIALKKVITILLIAVHLFNLMGYQAVWVFLHLKNTKQTETLIEKGLYSHDELVLLKVHYPVPYAANWVDYENVDGSIEIQGVRYNYVQRKLANDTLYIKCLPNYEQARLAAAKNDINKELSAVTTFTNKHKSAAKGKLVSDLSTEFRAEDVKYAYPLACNDYFRLFLTTKDDLISRCLNTPYQPPKCSV